MGIYLVGYWIVFLAAVLKVDQTPTEIERCYWAVLIHTVGIGLQIGSDVQKSTTLQIKDGLITNGFFEKSRNPNYLGELLICLSLAMLSKSYFCWAYLTFCWILVFGTGILKKEASLMQKDGFKVYQEKSLILFPRLFKDYLKNYYVYTGCIAIIYLLYLSGGFLHLFGIRTPRKTYEIY
jgi:steroid 5-alpha reductase family enzyme